MLADCQAGLDQGLLDAEEEAECGALAWCVDNPENEDCLAWAAEEGYDVDGGEEGPQEEGQEEGPVEEGEEEGPQEEGEEEGPEEGDDEYGDDDDDSAGLSTMLWWCGGDDDKGELADVCNDLVDCAAKGEEAAAADPGCVELFGWFDLDESDDEPDTEDIQMVEGMLEWCDGSEAGSDDESFCGKLAACYEDPDSECA